MEGEGTILSLQVTTYILILAQARLKSLHEVVVRNRLEQLRKRQRDEALQAQEELLEGVANAAVGKAHAAVVEPTVVQESVLAEYVEPYDRAMSPGLIDITKLPYEERQIDIVLEADDRRALVGFPGTCVSTKTDAHCYSSNNVEQWLPLDSFRRPPNLHLKRKKISKRPAVRTWLQKRSIEPKPKKIWMKKRSSSISKRTSLTRRHTIGKTSIGHESLDTSTACIRVMSGISTTKHTTST